MDADQLTQPRRGPLHELHVASGARMGDFAGWSMPLEHRGGGVLAEHTAVRTAVGLFDVSHLGKVAVRGAGARAVVDAALSNDTARLVPGRSHYSLALSDAGGVVDDLLVYLRAHDDVLTVPNAANAAAVAGQLALAARAQPATAVTDEHTRYAVLAVQGPSSDQVLDDIGLPLDLAPGEFTDARWRGMDVLAARTGYTGERGVELLPPWDAAPLLWQALESAVREHGGRPCGLAARDTLRTEAGYPLHGHELGPDVTPLQARLSWAVGWDKPAFTGRDALLAERVVGPARRLWGLLALGRGVPRAGMDVLAGASGEGQPGGQPGQVLGRTTSGTFSPTLGQGIALALLEAAVVEGQEVVVDVRGRLLPVRVVRPPFVPDRSRS